MERATRDALTGLWNRATIVDVLTRETSRAQRTRLPLAVGLIDVDHFNIINETQVDDPELRTVDLTSCAT